MGEINNSSASAAMQTKVNSSASAHQETQLSEWCGILKVCDQELIQQAEWGRLNRIVETCKVPAGNYQCVAWHQSSEACLVIDRLCWCWGQAVRSGWPGLRKTAAPTWD